MTRVKTILGLAGSLLAAGAALAQPALTSKINADDQFKLFLSDQPNLPGIQFSQGLGWGLTYAGTALPPNISAGTGYYLNIWVGDINGGPAGLLGEFKLINAGTCLFTNGSTNLKTLANKNWKVTKLLPPSVTVPTPPGYPAYAWWNNDAPFFVQPSLTPASWQSNAAGAPNWPTQPGVAGSAHWIYTPGLPFPPQGSEVWFQTLIRC